MTSNEVLAILAQNDLCLFRVTGKAAAGVPDTINFRRCDGTYVDNHYWSDWDVNERMFRDLENSGFIIQASPPLSRYRLTDEGRRRGLQGPVPVKAK